MKNRPDGAPAPADPSAASIDVLADVLAATRVGGALFGRTRMSAPWGISVPPAPRVSLHVVLRGACWLRVGSEEPRPLVQGDVVLLPHGSGHALSDSPRTKPVPMERVFGAAEPGPACHCTSAEHGGGGAPTVLACGAYQFEHEGPHPVLALLPPVVHVAGEGGEVAERLRDCVALLERELASQRPGSRAVIDRLVDVLFVFALRVWLEAQPEGEAGWLGALRDPRIARALARIHERPSERWTVDALAAAAAMSRAAFARRFRELVGEPPLAYLTRWRMETAARMLRQGGVTLGQVASAVGYDSEFAFARAFKRARGLAPGRYRAESARRPGGERASALGG